MTGTPPHPQLSSPLPIGFTLLQVVCDGPLASADSMHTGAKPLLALIQC